MGGSIKLGLGAAAAGVAGSALESVLGPASAAMASRAAAPTGGLTSPPPPPTPVRQFVSRTDLSPPGVSITRATRFAALAGSPQPQYIFVALRPAPAQSMPSGAQAGLMILDLDGEPVWFMPRSLDPSAMQDPFNFRVQTYNNRPVLTWFQGKLGPGYGTGGTCVVMDSTYTQIAGVHAVHYLTDLHEFLLTPEGTALVTAYEVTTRNGDLVIGHAQEVDVSSKTLIFDWPCYPTVPVTESYVSATGDYFHMNSIDLWPGSARNLLVSSRNTCAVYLVSRATKRVIWQVHGKSSSFATDQSSQFWYQHDARALHDGSGISVFDDASQPGPEKNSWGKVITLDQTHKTARIRHEYEHTTSPIDTGSQGNCQVLPTGGHFVGFGANPYFSEYGPSGAAITSPLILDGRLPAGVESYRAFAFDWTGNPPLGELALAVLQGAGSGNFVAFASWNGATQVASWRLTAGPSSSSMSEVAYVPREGFETAIPFSSSGATAFQVSAVNAQGTVIGTSQVVSVA